jgi:lipopolysaccharide/colanic/teichoic acid biosynthesis glycosyltransferase
VSRPRVFAVPADATSTGDLPDRGPVTVPPSARPAAVRAAEAVQPDTGLRRCVDLVVAGVGLILCGPVIAVIGVLVRLTGPGPVLFRQERVGRDGRLFRIWKFRTMTVDAPSRGAAVSGRTDPRVTPVGRYLRPARLDELPQLVNVLRGDMTLIGPRPEVPRFVAHYTADEWATLLVRPGLIGPGGLLFAAEQAAELDQVEHPDLYYVRHHLHPKLAADLAYLRDRRPARDLQVAFAAAAAVLGRPPHRSGAPRRRAGRLDGRPALAVGGDLPAPRRPLTGVVPDVRHPDDTAARPPGLPSSD